MAQWLRICLSLQGSQVQSLLWEDTTCCRATESVHHNYWACEPQLLKPMNPGAHAQQREVTTMRILPAATRKELLFAATRESPCSSEDPAQPTNKLVNLKNWSMIAFQCCVSFCCTTLWISYKYIYIYIPPLLNLSPTPSSHPSRSSQSTELSYTAQLYSRFPPWKCAQALTTFHLL